MSTRHEAKIQAAISQAKGLPEDKAPLELRDGMVESIPAG